MVRVLWEDVQKIWYKTPYSSWTSLLNTLKRYQDSSLGIDTESMEKMIRISRKLYYAQAPFPDSPESLYEIFNAY